MRGESRRCKGSSEPLRRLPDGALATRRIVLVRCGAAAQSCGSCAARAAIRVRRAAHKGLQLALTLQSCPGSRSRRRSFSWYRRK